MSPLRTPYFRAVRLKAEMGVALVINEEVLLENPPEMPFVENDCMIGG